MIIAFIMCIFPPDIEAQSANEYFKAAQKAFSEENYEKALDNITAAIELNSEELEYKYFLALIFIKQKKYDETVDILKALIQEDEKRYGKAYFDLMGVYQAQNKLNEALAALKKAEGVDRERALLEQGYAYLGASEYKKAIDKFEQVRGEPRFSQNANYNLGIAYHRRFDYKKAIACAQAAVAIDPESGIAQNAKFLIDAIKREMKSKKHFSFMLSSTSRYDDNVILQPFEQGGLQQLGIPPSRQEDYATMLTLSLGYKPFISRKWDFSLNANFFQFFYNKLTSNNLTAIMPSAKLSFFLSPVTLQYTYTFGRFHVKNDPYANVHSASQLLILNWGKGVRSEVLVHVDFRRYLDGLTPDANHYIAGYSQYFRIGRVEPRLSYRYDIEDNFENTGDFFSHEVSGGLSFPFLLKTYLSLNYSYLMRKFEFTEVISLTKRRKDYQHFIYVVLSKPLGRYFAINFDYGRTFSDSNIGVEIPDSAVFDPYYWRKNIVSVSLTLYY